MNITKKGGLMFLAIDFSSDIPIYEQIRREIIKALAQGNLAFGQSLPSVRQLGSDIGVNLHTVNKAYKLLEEDGIITMDRRYGSRIVDETLEINIKQEEKIAEELEFITALAKVKGLGKDEFLEDVDKLWEKYDE